MNRCPKFKPEDYELSEEEPSCLPKTVACALRFSTAAHGWTLFDTIFLSKSVRKQHMVLTAAVSAMFCNELRAVICLGTAMRNHGNQWSSKRLQEFRPCRLLMSPIALFLVLDVVATVYQPSLPSRAGAGGFVEVAVNELFRRLAWAWAGSAVHENPVVVHKAEPAAGWRALFN